MTSLVGAVPTVEVSYPPIPSVLGISPHGLFAMLGITVGYWLIVRSARARNLPTEPLERAILWGVLAGILGARADYVISHPGQFTSIVQIMKLWEGGLALFGGLMVGTATAAYSLRRSGLAVRSVFDLAAPALPLAIAIGRIGDLLLTDHLGAPSTSGFAIAYRVPLGANLAPGFGTGPAVPPGPGQSCEQVGTYFAGCAYHLTPAYDLLAALVLFAFLWILSRRRYPAGVLFTLFVAGYATQRLLLDVTRGIDERPLWGLTGTQLLSIALLGGSIAWLAHLYRCEVRDARAAARQHGAGGAEILNVEADKPRDEEAPAEPSGRRSTGGGRPLR